MQDDSERDSQQAGGVIRDLVGYGRGAGEGARGREAQAAVTAGVSSGGSSPAVSHPAPPATESPATCQPRASHWSAVYNSAIATAGLEGRKGDRGTYVSKIISQHPYVIAETYIVDSLRRFASHLLFLLASQLTPFIASSGSTASHLNAPCLEFELPASLYDRSERSPFSHPETIWFN